MGLGALLAVIILLAYGKNARTDGFFAAYGVYGLIVVLAQSLRTTVVARLVEGPSLFANVDRFLFAVLTIFVASALPLVVLAAPLAALLTGDLGDGARDAARLVLMLLWPAAGAQLVAALAAAALGVRDDFAIPALAYVVGAALSVVVVLVLADPIGIAAVPVGVAVGSLTSALLMLGRLLAAGYRPRLGGMLGRRSSYAAAVLLATGSAGYVIGNLSYVISLASAARLGEGAVTSYTYSFLAASFVAAVTGGPVGIALAAPLAETWDRDPRSLRPHLVAVLRAGLVIVLPLLALAVLIGDELGELIFANRLTAAEIDTIVRTFVAQAGFLLFVVAAPVPQLAAFALSRYGAVAVISLLATFAHLLLSLLALQLGTTEALAAASSVSQLLILVLVIALVYRRRTGEAVGLIGREVVRITLPAAMVFGLVALGGAALGGGIWDVGAAALGIILFALLLRGVLVEHWALVRTVLAPLSRLRPAPR